MTVLLTHMDGCELQIAAGIDAMDGETLRRLTLELGRHAAAEPKVTATLKSTSGKSRGRCSSWNRVHRPVGYWTPAVHELLHYLDGRLRLIPRVHGFDDQGREVLDFFPGEVVTTSTLLAEEQLISLVSWTRAFHTAGLRLQSRWALAFLSDADAGRPRPSYRSQRPCSRTTVVSRVTNWRVYSIGTSRVQRLPSTS